MAKLKLVFSGLSGPSDPEFDKHCEELKRFISEQMRDGQNLKVLKKLLVDRGWDKAHISEAVRRYKKDLRTGVGQLEAPQRDIPKGPVCNIPDKETALRISKVSKFFGNTHILHDIDLRIRKGDIVGIIGLSGSGKTTLLNLLIGFHMPDSGVIAYKENSDKYNPIHLNLKNVRKKFGYSPQESSFYRRLTIWENLNHFGSLHSIKRSSRKEFIERILKDMGLYESRGVLARNLSGGMQRRLSIACSLIHNPDILVLDEPTADLDPFMRRGIWNLVRKINKQGTTIIITSHFLSEVEDLCHRIAVLHDKSIKAYGTPEDLKDAFTKDKEIVMDIHADDYSKIIDELKESGLSITKMGSKDNRLYIYSDDAEKVLHCAIHAMEKHEVQVKDIELNKPSLCEIFESYIYRK